MQVDLPIAIERMCDEACAEAGLSCWLRSAEFARPRLLPLQRRHAVWLARGISSSESSISAATFPGSDKWSGCRLRHRLPAARVQSVPGSLHPRRSAGLTRET